MPEIVAHEQETEPEEGLVESVVHAYNSCPEADPTRPNEKIVLRTGGVKVGPVTLFRTKIQITPLAEPVTVLRQDPLRSYRIEVIGTFRERSFVLDLNRPGGAIFLGEEYYDSPEIGYVTDPSGQAGYLSRLIRGSLESGGARLPRQPRILKVLFG